METFEHALPIDSILDNRYKIESILGEGGFGITYKAHDQDLDYTVVIKEFLPQEFAARANDTVSVQARTNRTDDYEYGLTSFIEEARTLAKFQHPNIVRVSNFLKANGTAYFVMDYAEGIALDEWLKKKSATLDEVTILKIIVPLLKGLAEVHKTGIMHRDIKPGNIFLRKEGGAMLIDFGAARQAMGEHSKSISAIISMGYAPPEQYTTRGKQGPYTDLYAVGAVLYKLIIGSTPIESPDRSHAKAEEETDPLTPATEAGKGKVSDWLLHITDQLLNISPKQRPQNADVVLTAIKNKTSIQPSTEEKPALDASANKTRVIKSSERFNDKSVSSKPASNQTEPTKSGGALKWVAGLAVIALLGAAGFYMNQQSSASNTEVAEQTSKALAKGNAMLYINSQPQGASVYLGEYEIGKTPYKGDALPAGQHELKLIHPDYQDEIKTLNLIDNEITKEGFTLKPATGGLSVLSNPDGAVIFIDGKNTQKLTPATLKNIKAGIRSLTLKKDRYYPLNNEVKIIKGKTIRADLSLKGGDLVKYNGNWIEAAERDRLKAQAKAQRDNLKAQTKAQRLAEEKAQRLAEENANKEKQAASYRQQAKSKARDGQLNEVQDLIEKAQKLVGSKPEDKNTLALAGKVQQQKKQKRIKLMGKMISVPGGNFQMGSSSGVSISAFKLGKYEVTQKQWQAVMGSNPSKFSGCDNCPVEKVSWNDIQAFLKKLNQQTGQRFRLPSEAEWEYACRSGGKEQEYCGGNGVDAVAWYDGNSSKKTHPVGQKQANGLGLYDMSGNVWEWAQDCWNGSYSGAPSNGSAWTSGDCDKRVLRGGSWNLKAYLARSAIRIEDNVVSRFYAIGFRLAQDLN